jgi:hypothetical protein
MSNINTDSIISGDIVLQRAKTTSHYHTDPKLIEQVGCKTMLKPGMLVCIDKDGVYKPAIATCQRYCNIIGIVISFVGDDAFYLKHNHGHMSYREPLPPDWFFTIDGKVDEMAPLFEKIPNTLGNPVYLSDTVPGGMMSSPPLNNKFVVQAGYRTEYGFYFKPEPFCCASLSYQNYDPDSCNGIPDDPNLSSSSTSTGTCDLDTATMFKVTINGFCGYAGVFALSPVASPPDDLDYGVILYKSGQSYTVSSRVGAGNAGYAKYSASGICQTNSRLPLVDYNSTLCFPSGPLTNYFAILAPL